MRESKKVTRGSCRLFNKGKCLIETDGKVIEYGHPNHYIPLCYGVCCGISLRVDKDHAIDLTALVLEEMKRRQNE